ncbi:hypothetical protein PAEPH01_1004 [Pancytospora epiphaga]|nr:hypothetical protein PAEPH01_1004 [Pancytospora epiphaga]
MSFQDDILQIADSAGQGGCCYTKVHFTEKNICIQDLKPSHYEGSFLEARNEPPSLFVSSILESYGGGTSGRDGDFNYDIYQEASRKSILEDLQAELAVDNFGVRESSIVNSDTFK